MRCIALVLTLLLLLTACAAQPSASPAPTSAPTAAALPTPCATPLPDSAAQLTLNDWRPFAPIALTPDEFVERLQADQALPFEERTDAIAALGLAVPPPLNGDMDVWQAEVNIWTTLHDDVFAKQSAYTGVRAGKNAQYVKVRMASASGNIVSSYCVLFEQVEEKAWQLIDMLPGAESTSVELGNDTLFVLYLPDSNIALYDPALRCTVALWHTAQCPDGLADCRHVHPEFHMTTFLSDFVTIEEKSGEYTLKWFTFYDREDGERGAYTQSTVRRADGTWEQLPGEHVIDPREKQWVSSSVYEVNETRFYDIGLKIQRDHDLIYKAQSIDFLGGMEPREEQNIDLTRLPEDAIPTFYHNKLRFVLNFADIDADGYMDLGVECNSLLPQSLSGTWWRWDPQTEKLEFQFFCYVEDEENWIDPVNRTVTYVCRCGACNDATVVAKMLDGGGLELPSGHADCYPAP